jgi:putative flippase GtrA
MLKILAKLRDAQFVRYFVASIGALAVDMGSFLLLLETPVPAGVSAAIAYTLGIIAHWILLSRSVFEQGTEKGGMARTRQKAVFLLTTWGGLAVTTGIVSLADLLGADVRISKGLAVVISFVMNYFVRKHFIFTADNRPA